MMQRKDIIEALEVLGKAFKDTGLYITSHKDNEFMVCVKDSEGNVVYEDTMLGGTLRDISKAFGDSIQLKGLRG